MNKLGIGITSYPLLLGVSEDNTHHMVVSIVIVRISKNGSFRFLNKTTSESIGKFKIMETCEVTKHSAVVHQVVKDVSPYWDK